MTFVAPLFLLAVLAGAIPVVLHMIHRQKALEVRFSSLRFLKLSVERTRRRKYIDDLGLLALRVAALVLLAIGLANPTLSILKDLMGQDERAAAIILDNSASMATVDNGTPRIDTARQVADKIIDTLGSGDQVSFFLTGGPPEAEQGKLFQTHERVRQILSQTQASYERADLAGKIQQARALLSQAEKPIREIYVITDNQSLSWESLKEESLVLSDESARVPVILINLNSSPSPNVALRNIKLDTPAPAVGVPIQVRVEVVNTSDIAQQKNLELYVDGSKQAVSPTLNLPPNGTLSHEFRFSLDRGGIHGGEIRLAEEDGLSLDNRQFFALAVDQGVPVAIVKPKNEDVREDEETFYLEAALGSEVGIRVTTLTLQDLAAEPIANYAVVFCVNLPVPPPNVTEKLRNYVAGGGNLFWTFGSNVQVDDYNRMNEQYDNQLLPAPLNQVRDWTAEKGDSRILNTLDREHRAVASLTEWVSLKQSVLVHKQCTFKWTPETGAQVLARLNDEQPILLEKRIGSGSVLMLGTAVHVGSGSQGRWTNLPVTKLFRPLFSQLVFYLAGIEAGRVQIQAASPLLVPLGQHAQTPDVEVVTASGETIRVPSKEIQGPTFRFLETFQTGIYKVRLADPTQPKQYAFAVNMDPAESDSGTIEVDDLKKRFGQYPARFCKSWSPEDVKKEIEGFRRGWRLGDLFLMAVLACLVFETFLSNWLGTKTPPPATPPQDQRGRMKAVLKKEVSVPANFGEGG